jgi:hypothetical protein
LSIPVKLSDVNWLPWSVLNIYGFSEDVKFLVEMRIASH